MADIMRVEGLSKNFGSLQAVDKVSFGIKEGICFGLLGPNGAGKTTTIEMMEGITPPSGGTIYFRDKPIDKSFKQKVGIQFQNTALPEFITVRETIKLFRSFYPNPRSMEELIDICSLSDIVDRDNRKLSGGQRQRMLLAIAIIPHPEVVFLDEPTTGLDPQARRNFWDLIGRIKGEGSTIILTTHYMDEAQLLCDEIAIMDRGHILEQDKPQKLLDRHFPGALVRFPQVAAAGIALDDAESVGDNYEIVSANLDETLKRLLAAKVNMEGLSIHKPNLEDLFIKLTGGSLRS